MLQDVTHGFRSLMRTPSFLTAALLTLALGIGSTAAIFSIAYAVMLKPVPYPDADRLYVLSSASTWSLTGEIFHHVRDRVRVFENVAAEGGSVGWNLVVGDRAEHVNGRRVTRGYFDVIGVAPAIGRGFSVVEDTAGGPRVTVLSAGLARRLFGDRSNIIGETVLLSGTAHTVVGVMPASFWQPTEVDLWTPARLSSRDNSWNYPVIGRIRRGVTEAQIAADLDAVRADLRGVVRDLSGERADRLKWMPIQDWLGVGKREPLELLSMAVSFLLLIACVNVASLQLVRAVARRRELATRAALGADRVRLIRQLIGESVVVALLGGALGLLAAHWGLTALLSQVPDGLLGNHVVTLDWRVAMTVLAVAVASGVLFGLIPALSVSRFDVRTALVEAGRQSAGAGALRLRRLFTGAQIALAVVLLASAGVMFRSLVNLRSAPLGFDPDNVVNGKMSLQGSAGAVPGGIGALFHRGIEDLRKVPGVAGVAVANNIPVERGLNLPIHPPAGGVLKGPRAVDWRWVSTDYFSVFRIPLRDGRRFDRREQASSPPVAIVNEAFARFFFGRPNVVGETIQLMLFKDAPRQIVGVVGDVKGRSGAGWTSGINALAAPAAPVMYVPVTQVSDEALAGFGSLMSWTVRTTVNTDAAHALRDVVHASAPRLPFVRFETMHEVIARDVEMQRFLMVLFAAFAAAALSLAAVGIYGLTAYSVEQRTQEIGIRVALGATRGSVVKKFVGEGLATAGFGLLIGIVGASYMGRTLESMIFAVTPSDPTTFIAVAIALLAITGIATLIPSLRAAQTDPARAMRVE